VTSAPASRVDLYRAELLERILPWWEEHAIDSAGGVFTCFGNTGELVSHDKYTWSQGRWAWLCHELAVAGRQKLIRADAAAWDARSVATARHLERTLVADGTEVAFVTDRDGTHLPDDDGAVSLSVYADLFAALGFVGASSSANDPDRLRWSAAAHRLLAAADRSVRDGSAPSAPYPVPAGFVDLGRTMLLLNVATEVNRHTGSEQSRDIVEAAVDRVVGPDGQWDAARCWEFRPSDPAGGLADTLLANHINPGHILELAWMLLDAAHVSDTTRSLLPDWLPVTVLRTLELGWDAQHGGILRFVDRHGGAPTGRRLGDSAYEDLVVDTWDTKLWWVHIEALLACEMFAVSTGDPAFDAWSDRLADYILTTFPDPAGGEWLQIRDRAGAPLDRVVALPVKDPFHVPRALIRMIRLHEGTPAS